MPVLIESGPDAGPPAVARPLWPSMWRGFQCRCPACGKGSLFGRYLKPVASCPSCGEDLSHQRADDAPPYFTIMVVGHIVVPAMLVVETRGLLPMAVSIPLWLVVTLALCLIFLQPIKGTIIGLQWALRMHGFDPAGDPTDPPEWQARGSG